MSSGERKVAEILCRRDGITMEEADELISIAISLMEDCSFEMDECEGIMADVLGLEMDYIFDLLT